MSDTVAQELREVELMSKLIRAQLALGELKWDDEVVQYFIPAVLYWTNWDWLKLIAENNLTEEDATVVNNFLDMAKSLCDVNGELLSNAVANDIKGLFK